MSLRRYLVLIVLLGWLPACATLGGQSAEQSAFDQGLALFQQGRYAEAIPHLQRAADLDPQWSKAYLYLGRAYLSTGQWLQAIPVLRTAFRLAPQESQREISELLLDALLGAATSALKDGKFGESIGLFKEAMTLAPQATTLQPQLVEALLGLGAQLLLQGQLPGAIKAFTEATHLNPQQVEGYLGLAKALVQQGDVFQALAIMHTAMQLAPSNNQLRSLWQQFQGH